PSGGRPFPLGLILASRDCVSLDIVVSQIAGFKPTDILTSVNAIERGLGPTNLEEIEIVGEELKDVIRRDFQKPSTYTGPVYRELRRLLTPIGLKLLQTYPRIEVSRCRKCSLCAEKCPTGAIIVNRYPRIDYKKCIQCFTCYEFCPEGAIQLRRSWLIEQLQRK
ncbi:MAG: 4Fe-4S binding protein, partial [Candidatus Latescibacteria bacterium]|nr:4Fe-4S binding protein [Candidatus Latescibacterota bacterium]